VAAAGNDSTPVTAAVPGRVDGQPPCATGASGRLRTCACAGDHPGLQGAFAHSVTYSGCYYAPAGGDAPFPASSAPSAAAVARRWSRSSSSQRPRWRHLPLPWPPSRKGRILLRRMPPTWMWCQSRRRAWLTLLTWASVPWGRR
jgi:hypothetical protein